MSDDTGQVQRPELKDRRAKNPWLGGSAAAIASALSWVEVLAVALLAALLFAGFSGETHTPVKDARGWDTLRIDGNRADRAVMFPHGAHQKRIGASQEACRTCHHMSKPMDGPTACHVCHRDMYVSRSIFDHDSHRQAVGRGNACKECHPKGKAREDAKHCKECHTTYTKAPSDYVARSYESAMHSRCAACHRKQAKKLSKPEIAKCLCCHKENGAKQADSGQ